MRNLIRRFFSAIADGIGSGISTMATTGKKKYLNLEGLTYLCSKIKDALTLKLDKSQIVQNATTAATDKVPSAAVVKNLQDQITQLNTKIDNTVVTIDQMWCVAHFVRGAGLWLDINTNRAVSIEGVDVYDNTSKWMHSYIESQSNVFGNRHFILNTNGMSLTEGYSYLVKISGKMS